MNKGFRVLKNNIKEVKALEFVKKEYGDACKNASFVIHEMGELCVVYDILNDLKIETMPRNFKVEWL